MSQVTQFGEAEVDTFIKVDRADGNCEHFHVVNGVNVPISATQYEQATKEAS